MAVITLVGPVILKQVQDDGIYETPYSSTLNSLPFLSVLE